VVRVGRGGGSGMGGVRGEKRERGEVARRDGGGAEA